jgi:hypothetical protein
MTRHVTTLPPHLHHQHTTLVGHDCTIRWQAGAWHWRLYNGPCWLASGNANSPSDARSDADAKSLQLAEAALL